jgi:hypothetical protein
MKNYSLKILQSKPCINILRDEASTKFHVKNNDYFGSLATIVSLIKEKDNLSAKEYKKILCSIQKDLTYLQDNYKIYPK